MLKKILHKLNNSIAGGAIIIAVFSVLSRLLGLVRDRFLASNFGAGDVLDVYYTAFRLPDLVFNTLVLGALSVAFIPVFLEYWHKDKEEAWKIANSILNVLLVIILVIGGIFFIFTKELVTYIIAPGFDFAKQQMTIELTRIMLASIVFFTVSNIFSSILNSFKRFIAYGLAPVMYNLGIIFGIVCLVPKFGYQGLAYGVLVGSILHLLVQVPAVLKTGFRWRIDFKIKHPAVLKMGILMLPRTFALAIGQVNKLVITIIGSTLAAGTIAVYNLADNLQSVPTGIFAIPLAVACFPYLSESVAKNDQSNFGIHFSVTFRRILFLIIPATVFVFLFRAQIVRLILGTGQFSWQDTHLTLATLGYFSVSLFAQALIPLLARSFYAFQDTKTPVYISLISVFLNIGLAIWLGKSFGAPGLALAFSISTIINFVLLLGFLKKKKIWLDLPKIVNSTFKIIILSVVTGIVIQGMKTISGNWVDMQRFWGVLTQFVVASIVGGGIYLGLALFIKMDEVAVFNVFVNKFKMIFRNGK
ncbi:MAG: murein biosynthesis integral membrane protein MurJ [Patescibacteria group bacterium]